MLFTLLRRMGYETRGVRVRSTVLKKMHRTYKSHPRVFQLVAVALLVLYFWSGSRGDGVPYRASTTGKDQWINVQPNFLPASEFETIAEACGKTEGLEGLQKGVYSDLTRGWVVKFSANQRELFEKDPRFTGFLAYFEKVVSSSTTDFVIRLVVSPSDPMRKTIIKRHHDEIIRRQRFTPHTISMLFAESPDDMIGGELTIWPGLTAFSDVRSIPTVILPSTNILSVLRGDSDYKLNGFKSYTGGNLSVIIVEQYQLPLSMPKNLTYYCHEEDCA